MHETGIIEGGFSRKERPDADGEYQAFSFGRIGNRVQPVLLVRSADGQVEGFPYAEFGGIISEDEENGFTVKFGARTVSVEGRNLKGLFDHVCTFRAAEICEASENDAIKMKTDEATVWTVRVR